MGNDTVFFLVLMVVVTGIGGYAVYDFYAQQVGSQRVEAVITHSDTWRGEEQTHLELEYRYTYQGTTYNSTNVCPSTLTGGTCYGAPENVVDRYPEGKNVTAYVDPTEPTNSYLIERGTPYWLFVLTGGSALFSLLILRDLLSDGPDWKRQ